MNYKQKIGKYGEDLACDFLKRKGYKIISQNVKLSFQEIDIISKYGNVIVFVEVKTRTGNSFGEADEVVTEDKIDNLQKAICHYISNNKLDPTLIRLDLIAVDISKENKTARIRHYKDIF